MKTLKIAIVAACATALASAGAGCRTNPLLWTPTQKLQAVDDAFATTTETLTLMIEADAITGEDSTRVLAAVEACQAAIDLADAAIELDQPAGELIAEAKRKLRTLVAERIAAERARQSERDRE